MFNNYKYVLLQMIYKLLETNATYCKSQILKKFISRFKQKNGLLFKSFVFVYKVV